MSVYILKRNKTYKRVINRSIINLCGIVVVLDLALLGLHASSVTKILYMSGIKLHSILYNERLP